MKRWMAVCMASLLLCACTPAGELPVVESTETTTHTATAETMIATEASVPVFLPIGDDLPISRGLVAKMLAFTAYDEASIDQMNREITFLDTARDLWYDRYINACVVGELLSGSGDLFLPEQSLTMAQAQTILDRVLPNNAIKMQTAGVEDKPISYALWLELYLQMLTALGADADLSVQELIVHATPDNHNELPIWRMITNRGAKEYDGLHMAAYIDKKIKVLSNGNEIVAIIGLVDDAPLIENAYIVQVADVGITLFSGGAERTYLFADGLTVDKKLAGNIADVRIKDGVALSVQPYTESITGVIKQVTSEYIELSDQVFPLDAMVQCYVLKDGLTTYGSLHKLIVGTNVADFVVRSTPAGTEVLAAIVVREHVPDTMRIVLGTSGFSGLFHESVVLTANVDFTLSSAGESVQKKAHDVVNVHAECADWLANGRVTVTPAVGGKIQIQSISRNWPNKESPWYRGTLEVVKEQSGHVLVNEVSMEAYLYAVVPSEMPQSHGLEAAKLQAITARSYAVNQNRSNRFAAYGGHVDDSVTSQVYNNISETEMSIQAVDETAGQCLTYQSNVVSANFFSTSGGMTANSGEVWANGSTKQFPTMSAAYLTSVKQYTGEETDFSTEEAARAFYTNRDVTGYDSSFAWFRWTVAIPVPELSHWIAAGIESRYAVAPKQILTKQADGSFRSRAIDSFGTLLDLTVVSRSTAGNIICMELVGSEATIRVYGEYNIRLFLKPQKTDGKEDVVIQRKDGSVVKNYSLLPSAFMVFDKSANDAGELTSVSFHGGGNGHGVGMSQNGARGMLNAGFSPTEVLAHYYPGTEVKKVYE